MIEKFSAFSEIENKSQLHQKQYVPKNSCLCFGEEELQKQKVPEILQENRKNFYFALYKQLFRVILNGETSVKNEYCGKSKLHVLSISCDNLIQGDK